MSLARLDWDAVFFFKQKTAYELRISDWSSDVCSSDLLLPLKPDSIEQAIKLNGVATKLNIRAFRLGRLFIVDPEHVSKLARRAGGPAAVPRTLAEVIAHRSAHLVV